MGWGCGMAVGEAAHGATLGTQRSGSVGRTRWPVRQRLSKAATQEPGCCSAAASAGDEPDTPDRARCRLGKAADALRPGTEVSQRKP